MVDRILTGNGQVMTFKMPQSGECSGWSTLCKFAPKHPEKTDRNAVNSLIGNVVDKKIEGVYMAHTVQPRLLFNVQF